MSNIHAVIFPAVLGKVLGIGTRTFTGENIHEIAGELWSNGSYMFSPLLDGEWRILIGGFHRHQNKWRFVPTEEVPKHLRMQALLYQ